MDYFKEQLRLLTMEREADRAQYRQQAASATVAQRRESGICWYPVAIRDTEVGRGDYLTIELERTTHRDVPHALRFGQPARLFSNHDPQADHIAGVITWQGGDRLKLSLRIDELPDWASQGKLGVDLLFDENSYEEMMKALREAEQRAEKRAEGKLIRLLTGIDEPAAGTPRHQAGLHNDNDGNDVGTRLAAARSGEGAARSGNAGGTPSDLNPSQQAAIAGILAAPDLAIVHGPPGTGKTTTVVEAIRQLAARDEEQVLVTAPSNAAVDLLSEKLSAAGLRVLRVGNPAKVSERLSALTLDSQIAAHPQAKEIKRLKKQAAEFRNMAHKYKRSFGRSEREQRQALFNEARRVMQDVGRTEEYITNDLLGRAQVIAATLVGANHYTVRHLHYHTVVIDEAGQGLEPACWIAALKGEKLILAGDHMQLPPTIKSDEAARQGLATTLLEKLANRYPQCMTLLEEQYRMHAQIMRYSSDVFYEGRLRAHPSVADHTLFAGNEPLLFIDTAGCGFEEEADGSSTFNPEEAGFVIRHLALSLAAVDAHAAAADLPPSVGVISPYKAQLHALHEALAHTPELAGHLPAISVNTVDSFQGQERDIVYISMTRSNAEQRIGFLSDIRRMNVAMTRARKKLVVIGDSATLSVHSFYRDFIAYAEEIGAWKSAWEWMG